MERSIRTKEDILRFINDNRSKIQALGVRRIGLFGSFVRGEQRPESDVDLLVDFEPFLKTFDHFMELSFFLEESLQRRVELVTPESLNPHLKPHILAEVEYASLAAPNDSCCRKRSAASTTRTSKTQGQKSLSSLTSFGSSKSFTPRP